MRRIDGSSRRGPDLPEIHFSNGDLWPENLLVRDRRLVAVIDWQHAGFSDPIFEFLLPFFLVPELRGRGIEERYCERMGFRCQDALLVSRDGILRLAAMGSQGGKALRDAHRRESPTGSAALVVLRIVLQGEGDEGTDGPSVLLV